MANIKRGQVTAPPQWRVHLRDWKRAFWKGERKAAGANAKREASADV